MDINFCRRCGAAIEKLTENAFRCANGHKLFYDAAPATGALLLNDKNEVLLVVRAVDPAKGKLAMPGGFCDHGEDLAQALARELQEELGLTPQDYSTPQYLTSAAGDYLWQGDTTRVFGVAFWGRIKPGAVIKPGDDAADFAFFDPHNIPRERLAFESQNKFLDALIAILKTAS